MTGSENEMDFVAELSSAPALTGVTLEEYERAFGVPPSHWLVADEPARDPKRHAVSNELHGMAEKVMKLEADFAYQYEYNADLVEQLAAANKALSEQKERADNLADLLAKAESSITLREAKHRSDKESLETGIRKLQATLRDVKGPSLPWKFLALLGWVIAFLLVGVAAFFWLPTP